MNLTRTAQVLLICAIPLFFYGAICWGNHVEPRKGGQFVMGDADFIKKATERHELEYKEKMRQFHEDRAATPIGLPESVALTMLAATIVVIVIYSSVVRARQ